MGDAHLSGAGGGGPVGRGAEKVASAADVMDEEEDEEEGAQGGEGSAAVGSDIEQGVEMKEEEGDGSAGCSSAAISAAISAAKSAEGGTSVHGGIAPRRPGSGWRLPSVGVASCGAGRGASSS